MSCPSGKAFYVCAKGNFRGCCTVDPCTDGVCPDDEHAHLTYFNLSRTTTTAQKTSSSSTSSSSSSPNSTSSTPTSSETSSTTEQSTSATPAPPHAVSPTTATATSTVTSGTRSGPSDKGALIGSVVGGVVAAIAILAILVCLMNRRRKKQGKRFTFLRGGLRDDKNRRGPTIRAQNETTHSKDEPVHYHSSTFTSPGKKTITSLDSSPDTSLTDSSNNSITAYGPLPPIPPPSGLVPSNPGGMGLTPELSDTGFYRQRAELATNSHSELINVPPEQRKHKSAAFTNSPAKSAVSRPRQNVSSSSIQQKQQTPPIVTSDGVVLMPNLDESSKPRTSDRHVMSFMQYESGSGSEKRNVKGSPEGKEGGNTKDVGLGLKGVKVAGYGSREKG